MSWVEGARRAAALKALEDIRDARVVGIGSGTTLALLVSELGRIARERVLDLRLIPTSHQIEAALIEAGLNIVSPNAVSEVDLALDGADQVALGPLDLIKGGGRQGGGAALTREKIVDAAARRLVVVVDEEKVTERLGIDQPVPTEVIPFGHRLIMSRLADLGGRPTLRYGKMKVGPVITDNGNFVIDVDFGTIEDPSKLEGQLKSIPGVVETGLFLGMSDRVYVGRKDGSVEVLEPT